MDDSTPSPSPDRLTGLVDEREYEDAIVALERIADADAETRKTALRALRSLAADRPVAVRPLLPAVPPFLTDDERSVRLTTAKLFVAVAETDPDAVVPTVPTLAARLADEAEFYYVRARCAETLGYVALEHPTEVASPELVADLLVGLSFDEPEVKAKLAKALEYVALGDPTRLGHRAATLADHLEDERDLVRYHLATALVAIGCERPDAVLAASDVLAARLEDDENPYVRGRAAEAFGLLARADAVESGTEIEASVLEAVLDGLEDAETEFLAERARYAAAALPPTAADEGPSDETEIGTVDAIRRTTDEIAADIASPDTDGECPHCGLSRRETGPPMCPRCGRPY